MPEPTEAATGKTAEGAGTNTDPATATGAGTQTAKTEDAPKFTQADLDRIAAKTREEEKEKARKAKEKEDQTAKEKQGEFEKLYSALKPEHEALAAEATRYREAVKELAESELKALKKIDEDIAASAPSLDDPLAVLAWLPTGKKLAEKLTGGAVKTGNNGDPKPKGSTGTFDRIRESVKQSEGQRARPTTLGELFGRAPAR